MNTIKKEKIWIFGLIFMESLLLAFIAFAVCGALFCCLSNWIIDKSYISLLMLLNGFIAYAMILFKKQILLKNPMIKFMIIYATLCGTLLFWMLLLVGLNKFLWFIAFAMAAFVISAVFGWLFPNLKKKLIYLICGGIIIGAIFIEFVLVFSSPTYSGICIAIALSLNFFLMNMADFAKINHILDETLQGKLSPNSDLELAILLFINFLGLLCTTDATRYIGKLFNDYQLKEFINPKKSN